MKKFFQWLSFVLCSTFFLGFLPEKITKKPGAGAGLVASVFAFIIQIFFVINDTSFFSVVIIAFISLIVGLVATKPAEAYFLRKYGPAKRHDGKEVEEDFNQLNIDEVAGQFFAGLPIFFLSSLNMTEQIVWLTYILFMFRLLDVFKPWPINLFEEKLPSPYSVMFDDIAAGIGASCFFIVFWKLSIFVRNFI